PTNLHIAAGSVDVTASGSYQNNTLQFDQKANLVNVTLQSQQPNQPPQTLFTNETENIASAGAVAKGETTKITLNTLTASSTNKLFSIEKSGAGPMVVELKNGAIGGNGELKISSDLKRVMDTLAAMGSAPANKDVQLTSGQLASTLRLNQSEKGTDINFDGAIDNLTVKTPQQPIENEKITIALKANTSKDFGTVSVESGAVNSSFARTTIKSAKLNLKGSTFDKLQSASLQILIPDINKTMNVA